MRKVKIIYACDNGQFTRELVLVLGSVEKLYFFNSRQLL